MNLLKCFGTSVLYENDTCSILELFEYCSGGDLRSYCSQSTLTQNLIVAIFKDVCYGLSALHNNGSPICHNNIHVYILYYLD